MQNFYRTIMLLIVCGLTLSAFSQSLIFGQVQDAFLKTPLPEAKVSLLLAADSTVVIDSIPVRKIQRADGTVSKAEFSFQPEKKSSIDSVSSTSTKTLKGVVVQASSIIQNGNQTKIGITRDMRKGNNSVGEMLGGLPNLYFERPTNTLTYNNSSNYIILVDSIEKNPQAILNMQHIRFRSIEITTNPTGKYLGYDAVINLITKTDYQGYEGRYFHNDGLSFTKYNSKTLVYDNNDFNVSYTKNKLTLSAWGHLNLGYGGFDTWWDKYYKINGMHESVVKNSDGSMNYNGRETYAKGMASMDYMFDKYRSMSVVYNYNGSVRHGNTNKTLHRSYDRNWPDVTVLSQTGLTRYSGDVHNFAMFYRDNSGKIKYDTDVNYRYSLSTSLDSMSETTGFCLNNRFRDNDHFLRYRLSGWTNMVNDRLNLSGGYILTWKSYTRKDYHSGLVLNSNSYLRNKLWVTSTYSFSNAVKFSLSAWAEHIRLKNRNHTENQLPVGGNLMMYYQLSKKNWLRFNYDCYVEYPTQELSTSYGYFTDSLTYRTGNPWLKSNLTHDFRFWLDMWWCFNVQGGYKIAPNKFCSIVELRDGTLSNGSQGLFAANVPQNTHYHEWWASMSFTKRFLKNFLLKADVRFFKGYASYHDESTQDYGMSLSTSINYYYPEWKTNFYFRYSYDRTASLLPQGKMIGNMEYPYLSIQKTFLKDRLDIQLTYYGMFHLFNNKDTKWTENTDIRQTTIVDPIYDRHKYRLTLQFAYRFSGGKSVRKYRRDMSNEL